MAAVETFTADERQALAPYFTNLDGPVFALVNLPEVVKGALFARYSRSREIAAPAVPRRVLGRQVAATPPAPRPRRSRRAPTQLYERVLNEYGDDSVAQLGGVHLACEGASNILTKVLEWGRLMAYLEQSTRYVPYTDRPGGRWKYHVPAELDGHPLRARYVGDARPRLRDLRALDRADARVLASPRARSPRASRRRRTGRRSARRRSTACAVCCPRPRASNVGIFGTGQAYEALLPPHARASARARCATTRSSMLRRAAAP